MKENKNTWHIYNGVLFKAKFLSYSIKIETRFQDLSERELLSKRLIIVEEEQEIFFEEFCEGEELIYN